MVSREELEAMRQDAYDHDDLDEEEYDDDEEYDEEDRDEEDEDREEDEEEDEDEQGGDEHDPSGLQALLRRLGGGLEDMIPAAGQTRGRLKEILGGLRADGDDTRQIMALKRAVRAARHLIRGVPHHPVRRRFRAGAGEPHADGA